MTDAVSRRSPSPVTLADASQVESEARRGTVPPTAALDETTAGRRRASSPPEVATNVLAARRRRRVAVASLVGSRAAGVELAGLDRVARHRDLTRRTRRTATPRRAAGQRAWRRSRRLSSLLRRSTDGSRPRHRGPGMRIAGAARHRLRVGAVCVPHPANRSAGTRWDVEARVRMPLLIVVDGSGTRRRRREARPAARRAIYGAAAGPPALPGRPPARRCGHAEGGRARWPTWTWPRRRGALSRASGTSAGLLSTGADAEPGHHERHRPARVLPRLQEFTYRFRRATRPRHVLRRAGDATGRSTGCPAWPARHPALLAACSTVTTPPRATTSPSRRLCGRQRRDAALLLTHRAADGARRRAGAAQRARQIARLLGLRVQDQTRLATAVSEIARNAIQHAGRGRIEFRAADADTAPQLLAMRVSDRGPRHRRPAPILRRADTDSTGTGMGIGVGARRLMDQFDVDVGARAGTTIVWLRKSVSWPQGPRLPSEGVPPAEALASERAGRASRKEIQQQNRELLRRWTSCAAGTKSLVASSTASSEDTEPRRRRPLRRAGREGGSPAAR